MNRSSIWCSSCKATKDVKLHDYYICCTGCGKVVAEDIYTDVAQFGNIEKFEPEYSASRDRTLNKAKEFITEMIENMGIGDGDSLAIPSVNFYEIAVEKNFVRGRRADQVAAACLYITCRVKNKPFLLIEFSEYLRVNVYVLGAVFLQLCKLLHLQEHPIVLKLVDPSLFIHRFAHGLFGPKNPEIVKTALRIMTSMKRDWMQTGRKPSGLCGAALYISALSYGQKITKTDVIRVVHICEATLNKRLVEFEGTESGSLTIEEFNQKAEEIENDYATGSLPSKEGELLCKHKDSSDKHHFAHGLCEDCYTEFIKISGGLDGGSEPPAFQRAERNRSAKAREVVDSLRGISETEGYESDKSDNLSDIDDAEVDVYLNNEEETEYKKTIWEKVNWEYIEEQARKTAAGSLVNVPKQPKKRQQNKTINGIAQTAADAAHQMLSKKRVSSKINHDRLKELFDEPVVSDSPKRIRTESFPGKKNQGDNDDDNEDDDEKTAYEDYQDDPYGYNEEEYEEFDDGLF